MRQQRRLLCAIACVSSFLLSAPLCGQETRPNNAWTKHPQNPLLSLGTGDEFDRQNIFAPAIVKDSGTYFLFYSGGPSGPKSGEDHVRYQIGLAKSEDGVKFTKHGKPLLELGERDNFHATPALLRDGSGTLIKAGGLWHMAFCGNRADDVEYATSRDGITWEKDPRNPIFPRAYAPNLVQVGDEIRMYFIHKPPRKDGQAVPWEVHLATGRDFYSLKPHAANPVLVISQPWEKGALFYPYVIKEGATWVMFYASYYQDAAFRDQRTAIGIATSSDGVTWTKSNANPVLTPTPGSPYDSRYVSSQSVLRDGDHYKMYFASRIDLVHKYFAIGLATNPGPLVPAKRD